LIEKNSNASKSMKVRIAIQPDYLRHRNGEEQSFSKRWLELAAAHGVDAREVDVDAADFFERLSGCDGFMWRFGFDPLSLQHAKRLLPAVEQGMAIAVFPSWESSWHFEDKIAQHYVLQAAGIPTPRTWVWWRQDEALRFCASAQYPLVAKLSSGFQSNNVRLLRTVAEANDLVRRCFGGGLVSMEAPRSSLRRLLRHRMPGLRLLAGKSLPRGVQHGYFYVQEFLADNAFDTRVTIIGDRAFAFRRLNRPGDFRASGSGRLEWDPAQIRADEIRLAFGIARRLRTQSVAVDILRRGDQCVAGEISYTYASWAVRDCPGHWRLQGTPDTGALAWCDGHLRPEDAIFLDFIDLIESRRRTGVDRVAVG
jgi:hypothetical protein